MCNFSGRNNFPSTYLRPTAHPAFQQELEQKFRFFSHSWTILLLLLDFFLPDFNYPSIMCRALKEVLPEETKLKHFGRKKSMATKTKTKPTTTTTGKRKAKSLNEFSQLFLPFVLHLIYSCSPHHHHHHLHHSLRLLWFICVWIWSWVKRKSSSCWRNEWITRGSRDFLVKLSNFFYKFSSSPPYPLLIGPHRP